MACLFLRETTMAIDSQVQAFAKARFCASFFLRE